MTKRDIIIFLFKWKGTILGTFSIVLFAVSLLSFFLPRAYEAKSTLLVEGNRAPTVRTELELGLDLAATLNTEMHIILSRPVMERVVDKIRPHEMPPNLTWIGRTKRKLQQSLIDAGLIYGIEKREGWINLLLDNVTVEPEALSHIISISLVHQNPQLVATLVNAITDEFIQKHIEVYTSKGIDDFYEQRTIQAKIHLEKLERETNEYKAAFSIHAIAETRGSYRSSLSDLNKAANLLRRELISLTARYDSTHSKVQLARRKLAAIEADNQKIQDELSRLDSRESTLVRMRSVVDTYRASYLRNLEQWEKSKVTTLANASTANVRVIAYAVVPKTPTHNRLFYIAISAVAGMMLGLSMAVVRQYFDQRVTNTETAEKALKLPILGAIPYHRAKRV